MTEYKNEILSMSLFFEGGISYTELCDMSVTEFKEVVEYAKTVNNERLKALNNGKHR